MKHIYRLSILFFATIVLNGCRKTSVEAQYNDVFKEPYTTGIIKFQYQQVNMVNGVTSTEDTSISFTSDEVENFEKSEFGYFDPSVPWFQVMRVEKPNDFYHSAVIFFLSTHLDTLKLPYTFKASDNQNAQINYTIGTTTSYDNQGNLVTGPDTYSASTYSGNFNLTLVSNFNNRAQGTFSGLILNRHGESINITQGLFDVEIVDK